MQVKRMLGSYRITVGDSLFFER
jgi:hypothetical protein